ncbi:hypothetical protein LUX12_09145 [Streptomyces somaliensis]|uniref:hypothetical protein n=1 Tax=Streptomyces somaliensis TaxID=78355 RepID=UPI0020CEAE03|nr:hypothetical protein [Streptomyces somaliensis]MCP9944904.1 hypothetical protein [Streptomyces somaliensis]MCP9961872.1 hypothetical protein [Streptomyces somaliensis]MCP9974690.1 hypothetical protein [Streptomyces somaliensis]
MGRPTPLRLLPWASQEGKPSYLVPDDRGGYLSRLADGAETAQLAAGAEVLDRARRVLDDLASPYTEVRYAAIRLAECLADALRVAESRGLRLPAPDAGDPDAGAPDGGGGPEDVHGPDDVGGARGEP